MAAAFSSERTPAAVICGYGATTMANPLILLHGALGSRHELQSLHSQLAAATSAPVHVLEFSGHGSSPSGEAFGIDAFAQDLLRFMDESGIAQADIFGYSMGGYVALYAAHHYPERIGKVITLGTKFNWTPDYAQKMNSRLNLDKMREKVPDYAAMLQDRHGAQLESLLANTSEMMAELGEDNLLYTEVLRAIKSPTLLMQGDQDDTVSIKELLLTRKQLPNSEDLILEDTPHLLERADTERIAGAVLSFLQR